MGKGSKVIGTLFLLLGIGCFAMYFLMGDKFTNYKVVFDSNGGNNIPEQVIKIGEKATKPMDPTKENNEFIEWQLDGKAYDFTSIVPGDITLKALWKEIVSHSVKVTLEEKEYIASIRDGEQLTIESLNAPVKDGYLIKLYNKDKEAYDLTEPVTADIELTAEYLEIKTYTVTFNSDGGSKVDAVKVKTDETIKEPKTTKDGYIFDGWYLGETKFDFKTTIISDITLKARWNDGPKVNVIFKVDGTVYKTVSTKENTKVTKPSNPTKQGYRFIEWQLDGKAFDFNTKITSEITLNAYFEEATSFKVTFNSDGGSSVKAQEVTDKVTKPGNPTKNGYKFVRWELNGQEFDFNTTVTSDITLKAIWEKEKPKYTVRFNDENGNEITTQNVEEGSKATKPSDPVRSDYRFVGWLYNNVTFNFDTPITQNIVLTARFERINADISTEEETNNN